MLGQVTLVQELVLDSLRENEVLRDHGILPGNGLVSHVRVLVVVSLTDNPVVHGMVYQV